MKKNVSIYYGLLAAGVLIQVLITVFSLSQNIGYGQKISFLENKKSALQIQKSEISQELARITAIKELKQRENNDFIAISDVTSINRSSANLALK
jgi:hypothetical protein